jgi:hypothetical protein
MFCILETFLILKIYITKALRAILSTEVMIEPDCVIINLIHDLTIIVGQ